MGDLIEPLPPTDLTQPRFREEEPEEELQGSSAKIDQLVHLLQLTPAGEKSLVFSQFTVCRLDFFVVLYLTIRLQSFLDKVRWLTQVCI
jgi:hypothetical protein